MPLAHILAPLIAQKAKEIDQAINPQPAPQSDTPMQALGYLAGLNPNGDSAVAQGLGGGRAQANSLGKAFKGPAPMQYDPATVAGSLVQARGALDRVSPAAAHGFDKGAGVGVTDGKLGQSGRAYLIPNAPGGAPDPGFGVKPGVIVLPQGAVGMTEGGKPIDRKGKKTGFLGNPQLKLADPMDPTQTGGAKMLATFPGGDLTIEQRYRPHLDAMQANRDEQGMPTDKLPAGYFEALGRERGKPYSDAEKKDILNGIQTLRKIEKGVSI